jgi:hypothetical protein
MDSQTCQSLLSERDLKFITFWEKRRERPHRWLYYLMQNLPRGIIFSAPIALFFFIEAPRHRGLISHGDLILIMVGIFLTAVFYAIFRGATKWDQYESHYQILKMKEKKGL